LSPLTGLPKITKEPLPPVISLDSFPSLDLAGYLVGLNNASNETLALGLLDRVTRHGQKSIVLTPLRNFAQVRIVQMANIRLAKTGEELGRATGSRLIQIRRVEGA
jgi:polynucleotide 5'-kinase involved in rRNA processing